MKIPGIVFIGVGLLLSIFSFIVNRTQQTSSLTLFLYLGFGFIAFGAARTFLNYKNPASKMEELANTPIGDPAPTGSSHHAHKHHGKPKKPHHLYGYIGKCPQCGTPMREINIYCHRCGAKQDFTSRRQ